MTRLRNTEGCGRCSGAGPAQSPAPSRCLPFHQRWLAFAALLLAVFAAGGAPPGARAAETAVIADDLLQLAPEAAREALVQIPDPGRRLLALRSYVRAGADLARRWSWTEAEIAAYQGSAEQKALLAEIGAVKAHFAVANPGYEIYVNTKVRSLDVQIRNWNTNESVGTAGAEILAAWERQFTGGSLPPSKSGPSARSAWLAGFTLSKRPNVAAPGLTLHGQARAIDFQIMKDGQIIAGADSRQIETVWRGAGGWDAKLRASIAAAGPSFIGPLQSPDEPWHYDYEPAAGAPPIP